MRGTRSPRAADWSQGDTTVRLLDELDGARVFDLGQTMSGTMPQSPDHPQFLLTPTFRHIDFRTSDGYSATTEVIVMSGHSGTHLDGFAHASCDGLILGGTDACASQNHLGASVHGLETVSPILRRGVLLDVARAAGVDVLAPDHGISADELARVAEEAGVDVRAGDCVLVRTGLGAHWDDRRTYPVEHAVPGLIESAAEWLAEREVFLVGADNVALERIQPGMTNLPVHALFLTKKGILIVEHLRLEELAAASASEFLFLCLPLKLKGSSGSPVRPIAVVPRG